MSSGKSPAVEVGGEIKIAVYLRLKKFLSSPDSVKGQLLPVLPTSCSQLRFVFRRKIPCVIQKSRTSFRSRNGAKFGDGFKITRCRIQSICHRLQEERHVPRQGHCAQADPGVRDDRCQSSGEKSTDSEGKTGPHAAPGSGQESQEQAR